MRAQNTVLITILLISSIFLSGCDPNPYSSDPTATDAGQCEISTDKIYEPTNLDYIRSVFNQKIGVPAEDVELAIEKFTDNHIRGIAKFGEDQGEYGILLASKLNGEWVVLFDASGRIDCAEVEPYDFPEDMVDDCYDLDLEEEQM